MLLERSTGSRVAEGPVELLSAAGGERSEWTVESSGAAAAASLVAFLRILLRPVLGSTAGTRSQPHSAAGKRARREGTDARGRRERPTSRADGARRACGLDAALERRLCVLCGRKEGSACLREGDRRGGAREGAHEARRRTRRGLEACCRQSETSAGYPDESQEVNRDVPLLPGGFTRHGLMRMRRCRGRRRLRWR